ncbi:hypothetical protein, partial [Actinoplanes sp. NPDC020271]|uniref:hypothetical protein n=1 Tax=Actinoplanes sp. NPDC020271 TaxID=3363896 RepID=UPI00379D2FC7
MPPGENHAKVDAPGTRTSIPGAFAAGDTDLLRRPEVAALAMTDTFPDYDLFRPGFDGDIQTWERISLWRHRRSTPMSCVS